MPMTTSSPPPNVVSLHERGIVEFVGRTKQERCNRQLASRKKRAGFLDALAHFGDWEERWMKLIPAHKQDAETIAALLKNLGAPDNCYVVAADRHLDGQMLVLTDALDEVVGFLGGTVISCVPGRLLYFEGEDRGERYVLSKPVDAPACR